MTVEKMNNGESNFIGYVGDADFHDGCVVSVHPVEDTVYVKVKGASGRHWSVEFRGVKSLNSNRPEGMLLYALSELKAPAPLRRFVFANWDEQDVGFLEIVANEIAVIPD
jgi:hypothetical protein